MKKVLVQNRSSYLVVWPVIAAMFAGCIICFIFKAYFLSLILLVIFLVMLTSRLWAMQAVKKLGFSVRTSSTGVYPEEPVVFSMDIKNDKFLPLMCSEVYFPLTKNLCLVPDDVRPVEEYEKAYLIEKDASTEKVGEKSLPTVLWYETRTVRSKWTANSRGIYSSAGWKLRTGDGFGLSQMELPVDKEDIRQVAVFPRFVPVNTRLFLRMAWSADTGARGVMEDNTVIRSTRDYMPGDPVRNINWRLTAKGHPLTVNIYEEILPQSVYFIFDGESFSGAEKHKEEMEDALSIIASVITELDGKVSASVSFSEDARGNQVSTAADDPLEDILWAFAGYEPKKDVLDAENHVSDQVPVFDCGVIESESQRTGHFYYVTYDSEKLKDNEVFSVLDHEKTTILSYVDSEKYLDFETLWMGQLKISERPADPLAMADKSSDFKLNSEKTGLTEKRDKEGKPEHMEKDSGMKAEIQEVGDE